MIDHRSYKPNLSSCEIRAWNGYNTNSLRDQLSDGLIAQSVEQYTCIAEVMGLNPVQVWIITFFRL